MSQSRARLRGFREERGWTQREVAEHIGRLAWVKHGDRVGVNADMVAKWERGAKGVSTYYSDLLALLFGVEPRMLDLRISASHTESASRLGALADEVGELLERLGEGADVVRPRVIAVLQDQIMRRRTLLAVVGSLTMSSDDPSATPTSATFDALGDRYQELYHSAAPAALLTAVLAHLDAVDSARRASSSRGERARLVANRARTATLAGRLCFFDLDDPMAARGHLTTAVEQAREVDDPQQEAAALAHLAFIPAAEGATRAAEDSLDAARGALIDRPHATIRSWLDAVESEILADAGDHARSLDAVDRARAALDPEPSDLSPGWFDYYDRTRLAGFAGYAHLRAGDYDAARRELEDALALPLAAAKQRSVLLADLATVHFHDGELDEACRVATSAVDELSRAGYATGSDRVRGFLTLVSSHAASPAVRQLNERVSSLA